MKKAVDSRNQFGEPKIRPPYDQLPADIQRLRLWASSRPPRVAQSEDYLAEELQQMYRQTQAVVHPFGDTPLITIVAMRADAPPRDLTKERWEELVKEKVEQKRGHADLSTNSKVIDDPKAGYHVHLDDPDTVVAAVRDVIIAVLHHTPLAK